MVKFAIVAIVAKMQYLYAIFFAAITFCLFGNTQVNVILTNTGYNVLS